MKRDYSNEGLTFNVVDKKIRWGTVQPMVDIESLSPAINDDVLRAVTSLMRETWRGMAVERIKEKETPPPYVLVDMGYQGRLEWHPPTAEQVLGSADQNFTVSPVDTDQVHRLRSMIEAIQMMVEMVGIGDTPVALRSVLVSVLKRYKDAYPTALASGEDHEPV